MTDIVQLLGKEAEDLLQHRCTTIPAENLYLPGADFVDRVMIDNNRPNSVLRSMQTLFNHGRPPAPATCRSCRSIRASSTPPPPRSPPTRCISIRRTSSSWRLKPAVTASPPLTACWRRYRAATRIKFRSGQTQPQRNAELPDPVRPDPVRQRRAGIQHGCGGGRRHHLLRLRAVAPPDRRDPIAFERAHELGMVTVLWAYLRNPAFNKDGVDYHSSADLTGGPTTSPPPSAPTSSNRKWRKTTAATAR